MFMLIIYLLRIGGMGGATDLGKRKNRWDEDVTGAGCKSGHCLMIFNFSVLL